MESQKVRNSCIKRLLLVELERAIEISRKASSSRSSVVITWAWICPSIHARTMEQGSRTNIASCRKNNLNWTDLGVEDATRTHLFLLTWNRSIASKCWTLFSSSSTLLVSSSIGYKTLSRYQEKQRYGQINEREKKLKLDPNYPDNFWPRIIFWLSIGAFIYWVMTSPNADTTLHTYLIGPIQNILGFS